MRGKRLTNLTGAPRFSHDRVNPMIYNRGQGTQPPAPFETREASFAMEANRKKVVACALGPLSPSAVRHISMAPERDS